MPTMIEYIITDISDKLIDYLKNNNVVYYTHYKDLDTKYDYFVFEYDTHNDRIKYSLYKEYIPDSPLYIREDFEDEVHYLYDNMEEYFII